MRPYTTIRHQHVDELDLLQRRIADLEHALSQERRRAQAAEDRAAQFEESAKRAWRLSTWGARPRVADSGGSDVG